MDGRHQAVEAHLAGRVLDVVEELPVAVEAVLGEAHVEHALGDLEVIEARLDMVANRCGATNLEEDLEGRHGQGV